MNATHLFSNFPPAADWLETAVSFGVLQLEAVKRKAQEAKGHLSWNKDKSFHVCLSAAFTLWPCVELYVKRWETDVIHESCIHPFSASLPVNHQTGSGTHTHTHMNTYMHTRMLAEGQIRVYNPPNVHSQHSCKPHTRRPQLGWNPQPPGCRCSIDRLFTFMVSRVTPSLGDLINSSCFIF